MCFIFRRSILLAALLLGAVPALAQSERGVDFPYLGEVRPRAASEIRASNWSVGAETMDRGYTVYRNWKDYLGPLGVKKARVQAGWARTEQEPGRYDWAWLDEILFDMAAQGVEPWVNLSYGNPLYEGGGGTRLGAALLGSDEALRAWERWVRAMVQRYGEVVDEWEVWNEPLHGKNPPEAYAHFLIRTAEVIRSVQPEAEVLAIAMAGVHPERAAAVLDVLEREGKLHLIDAVTYHPYARNPDESYDAVAELREVVAGYAPHLTIRQGENGAPSMRRRTKALSHYDWSELSQAKWALRRLLGDLGRDIPSSYFSIVDMKYPDEINRKGLLHAYADKTVAYAKPAYYAVQHLTAVFDDRLRRIPHYAFQAGTDRSLSVFGYEHEAAGEQVVTIWFDSAVPSDSNEKTPVDLTFEGGRFSDPLYVDLREGKVYHIPDDRWFRTGTTYTFRAIPLYDAPILIADRSTIPLREGD